MSAISVLLSHRFLLNLLPQASRPFGTNMSTKSVLALLADGTEEMELVVSVDVLRRAGLSVTVASLQGSDPVLCSRGVRVCPDASLDDAVKKGPYDVVLLPGGLGGSKAFAESTLVGTLLKEQEKAGRVVAAICAAPTALKAHGVFISKNVTCYPSMKDKMVEGGAYTFCDKKVAVDGKLITSQGPGTSFDFALTIIEELLGKDAVTPVAKGLLLS